MQINYFVRFREPIRIGLQMVFNVGPFPGSYEASLFIDSTQTWAIPPKRETMCVSVMHDLNE